MNTRSTNNFVEEYAQKGGYFYSKQKYIDIPQKTIPSYGFFSTNGGHYTPIFDSLLKSKAYKVLSFPERLVLMDMLRVYNACCGLKSQNVVHKEGFVYSYSMCFQYGITKNLFDSSRDRINEVGFFRGRKQYKTEDLVFPSDAWKKYIPTEKEEKILSLWKHYE